MRGLLYTTFFVSSFLFLTQCNKKACDCGPATKDPGNTVSKLSYGDSVRYLKNTDYTISPLNGKTGTYTAYPDNLKMDRSTGKITVAVYGTDGASQTGMWYKINYRSNTSNEVDSTYFLISGITYVDKFYHLSQNDSIVYPYYNGNPSNAIPSGNYDLQHDSKFAINPSNGQININECARRGFFSGQTTGWIKAPIKYSVNDNSNGAINAIDLVIYYYNT
ncbi:MAG: hypothetical protein M3Y85_00645, partial [Bacteroidota bacterium]|nr:hypothetical protein [Bacteroidota bacterium]